MIEMLRGKVIQHSPTFMVMDVQGVGYGLNVSVNTSSHYQVDHKENTIHTYLHVKEDAMDLFGFYNVEEKRCFASLIEVSGVGPKSALSILSQTSPQKLFEIVESEDVVSLTKFKGIGKKTASLLLIHLKSKLSGLQFEAATTSGNPNKAEAIQALQTLGVKDLQASKAVDRAIKDLGGDANVQAIITEALKNI